MRAVVRGKKIPAHLGNLPSFQPYLHLQLELAVVMETFQNLHLGPVNVCK